MTLCFRACLSGAGGVKTISAASPSSGTAPTIVADPSFEPHRTYCENNQKVGGRTAAAASSFACNWDDGSSVNATDGITTSHKPEHIHSAECTCSSGLYRHGWHGYRTDNPETGEPPAVAFDCPTCSEREFGHSRRV